jgi:hypothetical protein
VRTVEGEFPNWKQVVPAAAVRKLGHSTEVRERARPGFGWLVLVTDRDPFNPEVQDRREREFTELVNRYEGEYDGSEVAVGGSGLCQRKDRGTRGRPPPRPRESSRPLIEATPSDHRIAWESRS